MDLPHAAALLLLSLFLLSSPAASLSSPAPTFNITAVLADRQNFTTFNSLLTKTNLSTEINKRRTITVCAVSDPGMQELLAKNLTLIATKNLLSLHVLVDYFDANNLQEISGGSMLTSTMFQASGYAAGSSGIIKISDVKGGKVEFLTQDGYGKTASSAHLVTQVYKKPYDLSVIQISNVFNNTVAEAPAAPATPETNITAKMSGRCKVFAETLANSPAQGTFDFKSGSGLTVFCPSDDAMSNFLPRFRKLSAADKESLLEYHGIPIYQTMTQLRMDNKKIRTLASGAGKPNFEIKLQDNGTEITIETKVTVKIVSGVFDSQPVAIYKLDKVLLPTELFDSALPPTTAPSPAPALAKELGSAPAPGPGAASPQASMPSSPPAPPNSPEEWPADSPAFGPVADLIGKSKNEAARFNGGGVGAVTLSLLFVILGL